MKKIHLRRKKKHAKINRFLILLFIIITGIIVLLNNAGKKMMPFLLETAEIEINNFSTVVINKAISQVLEDKINTEELFETVLDKDKRIQVIDLNPIIVNQVLNLVTTTVQQNIKLLEDGDVEKILSYGITIDGHRKKNLKKGIICEIPMGIIFKNLVISNIGPRIPIRLHYLGGINGNIKTKITPYGINNALVEVYVELETNAKIILPFASKNTNLKYSIPLVMKVIQGSVPSYYGNGLIKDSPLYSLPFE